MSQKLEKILIWIIKLGTIAVLFLPLLVYKLVLFPYVFSKVFVFQILVEIIFVVWLFLAVCCERSEQQGSERSEGSYDELARNKVLAKPGSYNKKYRPDFKNPLVLSLTLFMVILILTSLTGVDFYKSFWSSQERMTGIVTFLHFYTWFIVLISIFKNWKEWRQFIYASLICSLLVGLYGLGQKFGVILEKADMRMSATLGNLIFLAAYSMLHIFLAGWLLIRDRRIIWLQLILGGIIIFNVAIIFLTVSRGAMVTFGLSIVLFLIFLVFSKKAKFWLRALIFLFLLLIIVSSIFFYSNKDKPWAKKAPTFVQRLTTVGIKENKARLISWDIGLKGFYQRPILGWGWENYNIIFNKHYDPWYLQKGMEATWFDRTHNQVIDLLALTGILGALVYLSIFGTLFWLLFKKIKIIHSFQERIALVIIVLMFVAYFVQNLFVFDTPAPLIIFYFSLALVYFITQRDANPSPNLLGEGRMHTNDTNYNSYVPIRIAEAQRAKAGYSHTFPLPVLIFLVIIFLPLAIYKFNIEPFQQSRLAIRGIHASKVDLKSGFYWYTKALAKPSFTAPEIRMQLAKTVAEQYEVKNPDTKTVVQMTEFAIAEYEKSVEEHPLDARHWLYLGQLYNLGARYKDSYIEEAEKVLQKALEFSPDRQQIYSELARIEIIRDNYGGAIEFLEEVVRIDPNVKESHFNLALVYIEAGQFKKGVEAAEKAWELKYRWWRNDIFMKYLAKAYVENGNYNKAIQQYKWALEITPQDADLHFKLANAYAQEGDVESARKMAEKVLELNPTLKFQVEDFLKQLE